MPFNGSGTYAAPALPGSWNPAATGSSATPADWNTLLADLSTALSTAITKDGQTTVTADIPMATHKITGLGNATAQTDALNQQSAMYVIDQQDATAVAFVDFVNIAATVNNLFCQFELKNNTGAVFFFVQTYGADGVLDTGGSDYAYSGVTATSTPASGAYGAGASSSIPLCSGAVIDTDATSFGGDFSMPNIQAATYTKLLYRSFELASATFVGNTGFGVRAEADRITGLRISVSAGVFTGKVTLFGSV